MDGFTVLVTSLIFLLPTVAAGPFAAVGADAGGGHSLSGCAAGDASGLLCLHQLPFLAAYIRQYINLLIETFMTYLIVSVVIYAMQAAALASIGLFQGVGLVALVIYIWRIASALKLATRGIDLFGGGMLTGGATGMDLVRTTASAVGLASAAIGGGALVAAAGGMRAVDRVRGDSNDPSALETGSPPEGLSWIRSG